MPEIQDLVHLKAKNPTTVDEALFREKVAPLLLAQVAKFPELEIPQEHQAEFVRYALGTTEGIPSFVKASKHRSCLGLVKGLINPLFPIILQVIPNVGYARSKNPATGEFARPSEGNENPEERNTIRNPFEALIKSGILALQKRLTDEQIKTLLSKFKEKAIQESGKRAIHPSETSFAKRFKKITGHDLFALEENEATLEQCKENDKLTLVYFEWVIAQQILFFPENLCSDSHNFESMFPSSQAFTGTPSNDGCFPEGTKFHLDPGTLGESIDVLLTKCSDRKSFVTQHGTSPKELLHGLLNQFFQEGSKATALIDRGPLLNGMATKEVAHEIMAFVEKKRPSIKGVVYYEKGEQFILEKGAFKGTALKESKVQENERITYFDEPHTFAADIPQPDDAIGIISIGEHTTLEQLVQALWRLRKLKRGRQQPIFVMSEKVQSLLPENFSIHDIFYFCAKNQGVSLANLNYLADRSKIHNVTRRALLDRALFTSSTTESLNILKEFRDIFVTQIEEDPFILYGQIDRMVSPEEVFTHLRKSLSKRIEKYRLLSTDEKNEIKQSAEAIGHGFYPEKVHVYQVNKDIDAQLLDDLGRSMEIAQNQTQEQEQEQEQQLQEEQTVNQQNALDTTRESPPPFIDWPKDFSPTRSTDWVKEPPVPLFSVHEVLQDSRQKALKKVAPLFVGSLRATANFFQLTDTGIWARKVSPFGPFQKPSFEVLVVQNDHERTIILVDQKEADFFRDKLREDRLSKDTSPIKIGLYDIKNRTFAATGKNGFKDEELGSAFYRDITKLCFLDGQVTYTDEEQKDLVSWLSHEDPFALQKAFDEIHSARGTEPLVDSDISYVFVEAIRLFSLNGHRSPLPEQDPITPTTPQSHVWEKTLADRFCPLVSLAKHVLPAG
jgi:hypothetical protein